ncbi:hypothetical protein BGZ68_002960, partial [Mortierella alpina]
MTSKISNTYNETVGGAKEKVGNATHNPNLAGSGAQQKAQAQAQQHAQNAETHAKGLGHNIEGGAQKAVG